MGKHPLEKMIDGLAYFQANPERIVVDLVGSYLDLDVRRMVTTDQLYNRGVNDQDQRLAPPYAPYTVARKQARNQPYDRVTLRDTGDLHRSVLVEYRDQELEIDADDWKVAMLVERYGNFLGLTDANVVRLSHLLQPHLVTELRQLMTDEV